MNILEQMVDEAIYRSRYKNHKFVEEIREHVLCACEDFFKDLSVFSDPRMVKAIIREIEVSLLDTNNMEAFLMQVSFEKEEDNIEQDVLIKIEEDKNNKI